MFTTLPNIPDGSKKRSINTKPSGFAPTPNLDAVKGKPITARTEEFGQGGGRSYVPSALMAKSDSSDDSSSSSSESSKSESEEKKDKPSKEKKKSSRRKNTYPGTGSNSGNNTNNKPNMRDSRDKPQGFQPPKLGKLNKGDFQVNRPSVNSVIAVGQDSPVSFNPPVKSILVTNPGFTARYSNVYEIIPKIGVTLLDISTGWGGYTFMFEIFDFLRKDIANRFRTGTPPTVWSFTNFTTYLSNVTFALSLWYSVDSLIAYDPRGDVGKAKNMSMINYGYKFQDYNNIVFLKLKLEKALLGMWIPPLLAEYIRWLYQNYKTSANDQATIIRFVPTVDFVYDATLPFSVSNIATLFNTAITNISTDNNQNISVLCGAAHPEGVINGLPPSCSRAVYDENFLELYANIPTLLVDQFNTNSQSVFPFAVAGSVTDLPYYTVCDAENANGFIAAMVPIAFGTSYGSLNMGAFSSWNTSSLLLSKYATGMGANNVGNKYVITDVTSDTWQRTDQWQFNASIPNCFPVQRGAAALTAWAAPPVGWSRAYFDNQNQPLVTLGSIVEWMFGYRNVVN